MRRLCFIALAATLLFCLVGCFSGPVSEPPAPLYLKLDRSSVTLEKNAETDLSVTLSRETDEPYTLVWGSDTASVAAVEEGHVRALKTGTAVITVIAPELDLSAFCIVTVVPPTRATVAKQEGKLVIDAPFIAQNPQYPTGCESVSATMALQYAGIDLTPADFIDGCLDCGPNLTNAADGRRVGPSPYDVFIGSPRSQSGFGCYSPVILRACQKAVLGYDVTVEDLTGASLDTLRSDYLDYGIPVIFWGTMGMKPPYNGAKWYLDDGTLFQWIAPEHCLLLVGYTDSTYLFNDPLASKQVSYPKERVEAAYEGLGRQAIAVIPE